MVPAVRLPAAGFLRDTHLTENLRCVVYLQHLSLRKTWGVRVPGFRLSSHLPSPHLLALLTSAGLQSEMGLSKGQ